MRKQDTLLFIVTLLFACHKPGPTPGMNSVPKNFNGTVLLYDTLAGTYSMIPLISQPINIQRIYNGSVVNTQSVSSDKDGHFVYGPIDSLSSYKISTALDTLSIKYYGEIDIEPGNNYSDTLLVSIDENSQNGIFYEIADSTGGRIPGANIYIYSNQAQFLLYDSSDCNYHLKSDAYGRCLQLNVAATIFYTYGLWVDKTDTLSGTSIDTVGPSGIVRKALILKPQ